MKMFAKDDTPAFNQYNIICKYYFDSSEMGLEQQTVSSSASTLEALEGVFY